MTLETDVQASKLTLSVIGGVKISSNEQPILLGKTRALALLAFLVLDHKEIFERTYLASMLWGDVSEQQARNSLRQVVAEIRRSLLPHRSDAIQIQRDTLVINKSAFSTDLKTFFSALEMGEFPEVFAKPDRISEQLLWGFEDISDDYRAWVYDLRAQFEKKLSQTLSRLYLSSELSNAERIRLAEAAATVEPLNEEAYRTQMQIHAEMGEMGLALQAYSTIYHNLEDELGMDPSGATQDLVVKIKTGRFETPKHRAVPTGAPIDDQAATRGEPLSIPTVAVLPFNNIGPDAIPEYLSFGLLEDIVCALARLREPRVISSNSTRDINVSKKVSTDTFNQLGAVYFVSGTIRCKSSRFHISVQLAVSQTGQVVWAQNYESEENELFGMQGQIARSIARIWCRRCNQPNCAAPKHIAPRIWQLII